MIYQYNRSSIVQYRVPDLFWLKPFSVLMVSASMMRIMEPAAVSSQYNTNIVSKSVNS